MYKKTAATISTEIS